jgi:hypothetical protein
MIVAYTVVAEINIKGEGGLLELLLKGSGRSVVLGLAMAIVYYVSIRVGIIYVGAWGGGQF